MPFYIRQLEKNISILAILHFLLGISISSRRDLATLWGLGIFFCGFLYIVRYQNRNDEASIFASYLVGMEVVLRGIGASVPWEFGKYSTVFLLVVGMIVENIKHLRINTLSTIYFLSLLPAIGIMPEVPLSSFRQMISGNLSGPLCLFVSFLYFRRRIFYEMNLANVFKALMLPIISLIGLIFVRAPSIENITFSSEANFSMSAGFGPNQVSTLLGVSLIIVSLSRMFNIKIFPKPIYDYAFLTTSLGVALLTFARGGVIAPIIAISFCYVVTKGVKSKIQYKGIFYIFVLFIGLSYFSSNFTKGMINARYASLFNLNNPQETKLTGRVKVMALDLEIFKDNFLMGVGPGVARSLRWKYGYATEIGAHSEFTRMLSEHGFFGLMSLLSILILSFKEYRKRIDYNKIILGCMSIFGILTMFHSAFRIALPGYIYGLAYIVLVLKKK